VIDRSFTHHLLVAALAGLDCAQPPNPNAPPPMTSADMKKSCGVMMGLGTIESGGMSMDQLASQLRGVGDGLVHNRTGLEGFTPSVCDTRTQT